MRNPVRSWRGLPFAARFLASHAAIGVGLAAVFVGGLLLADPHGAGTVLLTAADHWWPALALWGLTGLTFATVQIGIATMALGEEPGPPRRGGGARLVPVPVRAARRR
ncbi:MAG TPA: hypothetical protein VGN83_14960 [Falsiroseomonas sp.]|jgi:hypothetical protein|nr:hypothetical protein [Falsiroseomonas sp.]